MAAALTPNFWALAFNGVSGLALTSCSNSLILIFLCRLVTLVAAKFGLLSHRYIVDLPMLNIGDAWVILPPSSKYLTTFSRKSTTHRLFLSRFLQTYYTLLLALCAIFILFDYKHPLKAVNQRVF